MLSVVLPVLVLVCNFLEETYYCHIHAHLLACFYEIHLISLTSHIYCHLDDCEKQYQSSSREMNDGADMRFRNSRTARNPIQGLHNVLQCIVYIETEEEKKTSFLTIV